jgi:hypothetical protein
MKWLVCINDEGVQCQVPAGRDVEKAAKEQKSLKNHAKIIFVFKFPGANPDGDYEEGRKFGEFFKTKTQELHKKYGAADPAEFMGYNIRKRAALGNGIEVLAELDADDYSEFRKKYGGIDGAIDILLNTKKVMTGAGKDPGKAVNKLIRKLEIEKEE